MSGSALEELAARKALLVARASLQRLRAAQQIEAVRQRTQWTRSLAGLAANPQARSIAGAALLFALRRSRLARLARLSALALMLVGAARLALGFASSRDSEASLE